MDFDRDKKRKRKQFVVDNRVEVRSVEEGFQGSWHPAIVIACENQARRVQYDHLLCDAGSQSLVEWIEVPPIIDGIIPASRELPNYRGVIRPLPPLVTCGQWCLHYGQCVDVYYQEAWWEGVIFDHEDGSEDRKIFFPDLGDEMQVTIDKIRITQDWDEFAEFWKLRRDWVFLELIEEFEQHWPVPVSVRQIWYEVRGKKGFQKLEEWTSTIRGIWKDLVREVIIDNCKLALTHFFQELNSSGHLTHEYLSLLSETPLDVILVPGASLDNSVAVIAGENNSSSGYLTQEHLSLLSETPLDVIPMPEAGLDNSVAVIAGKNDSSSGHLRQEHLSLLSETPLDVISMPGAGLDNSVAVITGNNDSSSGHLRQEHLSLLSETPLDVISMPGAGLDNSVAVIAGENDSSSGHLTQEHLSLLSETPLDVISMPGAGLENSVVVIAGKNDSSPGHLRQEHLSLLSETPLDVISMPGAGLDNSLVVIAGENDSSDSGLLTTYECNAAFPPVAEEINMNELITIKDNGSSDMTISKTHCHEQTPHVPTRAISVSPFNSDEFSRLIPGLSNGEFSSPSSKTPVGKFKYTRQNKRDGRLPAFCEIIPGPEFCPEAVDEYHIVCNSKHRPTGELKLNVRKHLLYLGWKFEFVRDKKGILRNYYFSPDGRRYDSLIKACVASREDVLEIHSRASQDDKRISAALPDYEISSPISDQPQACMEVPVISPPDTVVESEYCPQAVVEYYLLGSVEKNHNDNSSRGPQVKNMRIKAKKHLSAVGWSFCYVEKGGRCELRYISPGRKCYYSLRTACKACIDEGGACDTKSFTSKLGQNVDVSEETRGWLGSERLSSALTDMQFQGNQLSPHALSENCLTEPAGISLSKELVELGKSEVGVRKLRRKSMNGVRPLASHLLQREDQNAGSRTLKKRKSSRSVIKLKDDLDGDYPTCMLQSSKRAQLEVVPSSSYQNPKTVLSWLIDNNVVLARAKVHYIRRKDNYPMKEGRITRDGIKCGCCQKVFTLSKFEAHAGSRCHRPAANIFLEDGRSLLDCQSQLKCRNIMRNSITQTHVMKGRRHHQENDCMCSVCHSGGKLLLCDQCPASFHTKCLGLTGVPDGDWFCPSCCCGICGKSNFNENTEQFTDNSVLNCDQCEHKYHVGCLSKSMDVDNCPKGSWFCNNRCKKVFLGLRKLLGKSVPVDGDNLSWTLLKYMKCDNGDHAGFDTDALTENYSKLHVALSVMHECFEPVKDRLTGRDIVEDVIFGRWSELNRLNFRGFYTLILEGNDELITVATIRVHGAKVAEMPLVGTRFQFRRRGMCRILMHVLEKKLMELGVERLVLPAVPSVLNTWTTSFGFSIMTESEKLNFLDYTFLDFPGTIMCQKLLMKVSSTESALLMRNQQIISDAVGRSDNIDLDGNSPVSEVFQAEEVQESEIVNKGPVDIAGVDGSSGTTPLGFKVNQPSLECVPQNEVCPEISVEGGGLKECTNSSNGLKCYKRRRMSAC